ncbi:MAG TPA: TetR/AcrR family transcriptional regulator [Actinomycetota bacterium]|nr:TetR/AcrR family transcriptional regulator [Actinomycetota bacterium]
MTLRAEKALATKEHLIGVATDLFAERGYEATSIEAVLTEAGVSRGALYHHFSNKEALLEAVYVAVQERVAHEVLTEAMTAPTPLDRLRVGIRAWLERVKDPVTRQITLIDAPSILGWQKWREIDEEHFLGSVKNAIAQAAGDDATPERLDILSHIIIGALGEVAMVIARGDDPDEAIENGAGVMDDLLARMLGPSPT